MEKFRPKNKYVIAVIILGLLLFSWYEIRPAIIYDERVSTEKAAQKRAPVTTIQAEMAAIVNLEFNAKEEVAQERLDALYDAFPDYEQYINATYEEEIETQEKLQKSDIKISLKEKCASYIEAEKSRFNKKDDSFTGIFYSEKLESCVAKWLDYSDYTYRYFDVLTNEFLTYIRYTTDDVHSDYELTDKKAAEYEEELLIVR